MGCSSQLPREVAYLRAERAMAHAADVVGPALARATHGVVVVLDIEAMGRLNARYGLGVGDNVLADVEAALQQGFGGVGFAVRLPGDQFVVVLPDWTSTDDAARSARAAVARVRLPNRWRRGPVVKAHVGAARWWDDPSRAHVVTTASTRLKPAPV